MQSFDPSETKSTNLRYLLVEAKRRGYAVSAIATGLKKPKRIYQIEHGDRVMNILGSNFYEDIPYYATFVTTRKSVAHAFFGHLGLPVPITKVFHTIDEAISLWKDVFSQGPVVLKPENADLGTHVHLDVKQQVELENAAETILKDHDAGLIQEHLEGKDLRIQAVGGHCFAAALRVPAHVEGNGKDTIRMLIDRKNEKKALFNPETLIDIDKDVEQLLKDQGHSLDAVPEKGSIIQLRKIANIHRGADAVDVTDILHQSFHGLIADLAKRLSVRTFALDCIVQDPAKPAEAPNLKILEINTPCLWAHHHVAEGQGRNVAAALLDAHFYPDKFDPKAEKYLI